MGISFSSWKSSVMGVRAVFWAVWRVPRMYWNMRGGEEVDVRWRHWKDVWGKYKYSQKFDSNVTWTNWVLKRGPAMWQYWNFKTLVSLEQFWVQSKIEQSRFSIYPLLCLCCSPTSPANTHTHTLRASPSPLSCQHLILSGVLVRINQSTLTYHHSESSLHQGLPLALHIPMGLDTWISQLQPHTEWFLP